MHPKTLWAYERVAVARERKMLLGPRHFHASMAVFNIALEVMRHEISAAGPGGCLTFPCGGRLPGADIILTFDHPKGPAGPLVLEKQADAVKVSSYFHDEVRISCLGAFVPGSDHLQLDEHGLNNWAQLFLVSTILSLINEPRIVECSPAEGLDWTRQHRKRVQAVTGQAAMAFSTVRWKIGRRTQAMGNCLTEEGHPKALHWCRAHWRRAEEGQPKAEWVNIPRKGGWGWYCWAADCWKGHPDFGIKLQRHEPYIEGEPRSRFVDGPNVLDETRFSAMTAAQRAALFEAGYAPSRALN